MMKVYPILACVGVLFSFSATASTDYKAFKDSAEASVSKYPLREKKMSSRWDSGADTKKIAIYDDKGAWNLGVQHYKKLLKSANASYEVLDAKDILEGKLRLEEFDTLFMPGGKSWEYLESLGESGAQAIREYVNAGGSYFGTCAGAFYATSMRQDRRRGHVPYGIGLLEGTAYDGNSYGTAPFDDGMINVDYHMKDFKARYRVLLLGGPSFFYTEEEAIKKNIQVLSTYPEHGKPAMITFQYGAGRVAIVGPHGEVDEKRMFPRRWRDSDSEWPLLRSVIAWLRGGQHPTLR